MRNSYFRVKGEINMKRLGIFFYALIVFFVFIFFLPKYSFASVYGLVKEGNKYFNQKDYSLAEQKYKQALKHAPESDIINFDLGTTLYKRGDYQKAIGYLQKALLGEDVKLKQKALYNLGNAFYKSGVIRQDRNIDSAIEDLKKSLSYYKEVLKIDNKDKDAEYNYKYVKKELKRLQKKREEQRKKQKHKQNKQCPLHNKKNKNNALGKKNSKKKQQNQKTKGERGKGNKKRKQNTQRNNSSMHNRAGKRNNESYNKQKKQHNINNKGKDRRGNNKNKKGSVQHNISVGRGEQDKNKGLNSSNIEQTKYGHVSNFDKTKAEMLLKKYLQTEAPKKRLLNFYRGSSNLPPVLKDW